MTQTCDDLGSGNMGCLDDGSIPAGNETDCATGGCTGNYNCWCMDVDCIETICIENCST